MSFKSLRAYELAFQLAMDIYEVTKSFPKEERYSLTDQIRRSSRSVCANIAEGYRKRQYQAHFISKMSDSDMENSETHVWLDFSLNCGYISKEAYREFMERNNEIGKLLFFMISNPEKFNSK